MSTAQHSVASAERIAESVRRDLGWDFGWIRIDIDELNKAVMGF